MTATAHALSDSVVSRGALVGQIVGRGNVGAARCVLAAILHRQELIARHAGTLAPAAIAEPTVRTIARFALADLRLGVPPALWLLRARLRERPISPHAIAAELATAARIAPLLNEEIVGRAVAALREEARYAA